MDIWSSPNMVPFLGITCHWIERRIVTSSDGSRSESLSLRADLIGFEHLPGSHTGRHICTVFLRVLQDYDLIKTDESDGLTKHMVRQNFYISRFSHVLCDIDWLDHDG